MQADTAVPAELRAAKRWTFFVYGLYDPAKPDAIRYVGAASRLSRPLLHEWEARKYTQLTSYKLRWIRKVGRIGWRILAACDSWEETVRTERETILALRQAGARLTNANDGGRGGFNPSEEVRAKMRRGISAAMRGKKMPSRSVQHRAALSRALKGRKPSLACIQARNKTRHLVSENAQLALRVWWQSPENKAKYLAIHGERLRNQALAHNAQWRGRKHTPESRTKIALQLLGHPVGEAQREKMRLKMKGRKFAPETIEKMRAAAKRRVINSVRASNGRFS